MKILSIVGSAILALNSFAVFADNNDSSAIDARAVTNAVQNSTGAMIRVPIDASGRELTSAAEIRVVNAKDSDTSAAGLPTLWNKGVDTSKIPQLDSSTDSGDSSTHWGWNRYNYYYGYNYGWSNNYYYNYYTPTYYYGGYNYNYYTPYYYNYYTPYYYGGYNCAGYRYYYYGRGW